MCRGFITLYHLRNMIKLTRQQRFFSYTANVGNYFTKGEKPIQLRWGGQLYFVYLPCYGR